MEGEIVKRLVLLLAVLAGLGWWYFDGSRRMTEAQIRDAYSDEIDAILKFDADQLCARLADDFRATQSVKRGDVYVDLQQDRASHCRDIRKSMTVMQRLSNATGGLLVPDIDTEIKNIELSSDRKQAVVEIVTTARLGDMTVTRVRGTEHLIRRNGHILSQGGEFKTWVYQGE
jgi:hypothetical protein